MVIEVANEKNREYLAGVLEQVRLNVAVLESEPTDDPLGREIFLEADKAFIKELEDAIHAWDSRTRSE
jgi:hypothetical protein